MTQPVVLPSADATRRVQTVLLALVGAALLGWLTAWLLTWTDLGGPGGDHLGGVVRTLGTASVAAGLWWASRHAGPELRTGLRVLAAGVGVWAACGLLGVALRVAGVGGTGAWLPAAYAVSGLCFAAGALTLGRRGTRQIELVRAVADGVIVAAAAVLALAAAFPIGPTLGVDALTTTARASADALFVAVATLVWTRSDAATRRVTGLVALASVVLFVTDAVYLGQRLAEMAPLTSALTIGWSAVIALLGIAGLAAVRPEDMAGHSRRWTDVQQAAPLVVVLAVLVWVGVERLVATQRVELAVGVCVTGLLLAVRQVLVVRETGALRRDLVSVRSSSSGSPPPTS